MKKKNAGSLKEIVRNNSFAVSLIWKHCPFKIVYSFLRSFADGILGTIELFLSVMRSALRHRGALTLMFVNI